MFVESVKISGFCSVPFCATFDDNEKSPRVTWQQAFELRFPSPCKGSPALAAFIGANSSGKSSVLRALEKFFANTKNLTEELYNCKDCKKPVIIEITAAGKVTRPEALACIGDKTSQFRDNTELQKWLDQNCEVQDQVYRLTIIAVWPADNGARITYIRRPDGTLHKTGNKDQSAWQALFPAFRLIPASGSLDQEINPAKDTLMGDLFNDILQAQQSARRSLFAQIARHLSELEHLLKRPQDRGKQTNPRGWKEIEALEILLGEGLVSINPDAAVRFVFEHELPNAENLFKGGKPLIRDGVEIDPGRHGLGMQRSFVLATLRAWCERVGRKNDSRDYFFAVEEPEIYLHPHAIRLMLKTLEDIAMQDQVVFTTHSNEFLNRVSPEHVMIFRRQGTSSQVSCPDLSTVAPKELTKIHRYLLEERSDMLFARAVLLVEGQSELYALPGFTRLLGMDIDKRGISIVYTGGKGNFEVYHRILSAFGIPHVILGDGDRNQPGTLQKYQNIIGVPDRVFVLQEDFEYLLVTTLSNSRLLKIVNECRKRLGKGRVSNFPAPGVTPENLKSQWWEVLKEDIYHYILSEYHANYEVEKQALQQQLEQLAQKIIDHQHFVPIAQQKRQAKYLAELGKPLLGRVVGELLTRDEVQQLQPIVEALEKVVELAR